MGKRLAIRSWTRYSISTACILINTVMCGAVLHAPASSQISQFDDSPNLRQVASPTTRHPVFRTYMCGWYTCIHVSVLHASRSRNASYNTTQMKRSTYATIHNICKQINIATRRWWWLGFKGRVNFEGQFAPPATAAAGASWWQQQRLTR